MAGTKLKDDGSPRVFYESDQLVGTIRATTDLELSIPIKTIVANGNDYVKNLATVLSVSETKASEIIEKRNAIIQQTTGGVKI